MISAIGTNPARTPKGSAGAKGQNIGT